LLEKRENKKGLISNFVVVDVSGREVLSPGAYTILFENTALREVKVVKE
jgi:hypothetical protein